MSKIFSALIFFFSVVLGYSTVKQSVEAIVNNEVITTFELQVYLKPLYMKYSKVYQGEELIEKMNFAREKALWQLIDQKLISQEANKQEVEVKEGYIQKQYQKIKKRFGSEEEFREALEKDGMSERSFERKIKEQYLIKALTYQEVSSLVSISPKEVQDYYSNHMEQYVEQEKVQIGHILIRKDKNENSLDRAKEVQNKLNNGGDFKQLSLTYSDLSQSEDSSYLTFFSKGQLMPLLEEKVFSMNVGEISEMIESNVGYHFLFLNAKKKKSVLPLEEVWEEIHELLFQKEVSRKQEQWLKGLRQKAHIQIL